MDENQITGVENEKEFSKALNNICFSKLGSNASKFIKQLYPEIKNQDTIYSNKIGGKGLKPDVVVSVEDEDTYVSLKKGSGNSVHQENISLFLIYCKDALNMDEETRNSFLAYIYGDGTLDGKGAIEDRLDGDELKTVYHNEINNIQKFLIKNSRPLIERFLVYGRRGKELNIKADYLYHGIVTDGVWCPLDETVDYLVEIAQTTLTSKTPSIGPLTIQTWNRNLSGIPERENRRHSIQVKWGGKIKEYITTINDIYLEKIKNDPEQAHPKIFGDNRHGFRNAAEIAEGLDGCRVRNLRGSLLGLINTIYKGVALTDIIYCKSISGKPDIEITVKGETKNVSIFIGAGNAVHQENFTEFLEYCKNDLGMSKFEEDAIRFIYYGDGTLDGTGKVIDRISDSRTIKKLYPQKVEIAQLFFDKHRKELAKRFLVTGKYPDKPKADYIFYGNIDEGVAMPYDIVLDYISKYDGKKNGLLSIGPLSFQMWNRNLSGIPDYEYKRNSLQIKWASISKSLGEARIFYNKILINSKIKGISAEYELVSLLNSNRSDANPLWIKLKKDLNISLDNVYAIRVSHQVYSNLLGQKIYPKSDIYLCKADINDSFLNSIGYMLDEDVIEDNNINIYPIPNSGISCKIASSTKFTYAKIHANNFSKFFGDNLLGAGASVFVNKDINLNSDVIKGWNISEKDFVLFVNEKICKCSSINEISQENWYKIKSYCNQEIINLIQNNQMINEMIFLGKNVVDDPYFAPYIFHYGYLDDNIMPEKFVVTTGSGRHKGIYTIVIKPSNIDNIERMAAESLIDD